MLDEEEELDWQQKSSHKKLWQQHVREKKRTRVRENEKRKKERKKERRKERKKEERTKKSIALRIFVPLRT